MIGRNPKMNKLNACWCCGEELLKDDRGFWLHSRNERCYNDGLILLPEQVILWNSRPDPFAELRKKIEERIKNTVTELESTEKHSPNMFARCGEIHELEWVLTLLAKPIRREDE